MEEDIDITMKQRAVIRFLVQKSKSTKKTIDELRNIYTEDKLLPAPTIYRWHKAHWKERQSFTLQKLSG